MSQRSSGFASVEPTEKGLRALDRIKERLAVDDVPAGLRVLAGSESGISDIYMNLNRQLADGKLEERTKLLVATAVASATGSAPAVEFLADATAAKGRTRQEILDAISVAAVCSVFNGYYRFRHQVPDDMRATYEAFRAPFNANSFMKGSLSSLEVEAICIAVSSVNNCHVCVEGHIHKGKSLGLSDEQIDELIRVAAVGAATANAASSLAPAAAETAAH